ncbi:MAG TPA: YciI family protein [Acidobacteriaceae bacterium]|nr:YciI family protein [Acidobacteriaceae bacterium]
MDKQHFFFKLIPPRTTFPGDASAAELALMKQHADYFAGLFSGGKVLLYGPVQSPAGAFGIAILEAENQAQAREIAANDPSVLGGLNRFEVAPMRVSAARAK